ncbi:MAG: RDD family protein [Halobacteriota archaeon]
MDEEKCAQCGTPASPGAQFCAACGATLTGQRTRPLQQVPSATQPAPTYQAPAYYTGTPTPYIGVAIRFVATIIDAIIIVVIVGILTIPFLVATIAVNVANGNVSAISSGPIVALTVLGLVVWFLYFTLLEGRYGQTVGKMALSIKVVREADGAPIDYGEAAVRTVLRIIDGLFDYLVGAIFIWTSDKKQRLGDRVAHTVVVGK